MTYGTTVLDIEEVFSKNGMDYEVYARIEGTCELVNCITTAYDLDGSFSNFCMGFDIKNIDYECTSISVFRLDNDGESYEVCMDLDELCGEAYIINKLRDCSWELVL
jgi:hypothetical protein